MAAGAQVADYKKSLIATLPVSIFPVKTDFTEVGHSCAHSSETASKKTSTLKNETCKSTKQSKNECFSCIGITCSLQFTSKTNLRPSSMCTEKSVCRRCSTMRKAIDCANSIEQLLASHQDIFKEFFNAIRMSKNVTVDIIIKAISKLIQCLYQFFRNIYNDPLREMSSQLSS